jgi:hypothetical protein
VEVAAKKMMRRAILMNASWMKVRRSNRERKRLKGAVALGEVG